MQLVPVLLAISCLISVFSGIIVLLGSRRGERLRPILFACAMICAALWTVASIIDGFGLMGIEKVDRITENFLFFSGLLEFIFLVIMIDWRKIFLKNSIAKGWRAVLIGLLISGFSGFFTCLVLPYFQIEVRWGGPLIATVSVILYCYALLRYRIFYISNSHLKIWAKVTALLVAAMAYIVLFFLVSKYLFHTESSTEILALNVVMIAIVIVILPILNEINNAIKSLVSTREVNMDYIIKRLNHMATQNLKLKDLANFLADYMHFQNIAFIINGKVYASNPIQLKKEEIEKIAKAKSNTNNIWQIVDEKTWTIIKSVDMRAIAELRNAKGKIFGQILVGKPSGKISLEKQDLVELEKVINIIASMIDSEERLKG